MGFGSLLGLAKLFTGAAQQPSTIQRTEVEQKPATALGQVNAAVTRETNQQNLNLQQQLHATVEPESVKAAEAVVVSHDQKFSNQELPEMAQKRAAGDPVLHAALMKASTPDDGIEVKISKDTIQKLLTFVEPFLHDFKGNFDKFLSKPFDKPTTGIELMEKFFSIPLARKILEATGNYMGELSSKAAVLHPETTQAAIAPNPA